MSQKQAKFLRQKIKKQSFTIIEKFIYDIKRLKFSARFKIACSIVKGVSK